MASGESEGDDVRRLAVIGLVLDLGRDRLRVGADLLEHVTHDLVVERSRTAGDRCRGRGCPIPAARLRGALEQLARRVAEELGDVDLLDRPRAAGLPAVRPPRRPRTPAGSEKKREKKSSNMPSPPNPDRHPARCSARWISQRWRVSGGWPGRIRWIVPTAGRMPQTSHIRDMARTSPGALCARPWAAFTRSCLLPAPQAPKRRTPRILACLAYEAGVGQTSTTPPICSPKGSNVTSTRPP